MEYGIVAFGGFADFYRHDVPAIFAEVKNPALQQQLVEANEAAAAAMDQLKAWFVAQRKAASQEFALGENLVIGEEVAQADQRYERSG